MFHPTRSDAEDFWTSGLVRRQGRISDGALYVYFMHMGIVRTFLKLSLNMNCDKNPIVAKHHPWPQHEVWKANTPQLRELRTDGLSLFDARSYAEEKKHGERGGVWCIAKWKGPKKGINQKLFFSWFLFRFWLSIWGGSQFFYTRGVVKIGWNQEFGQNHSKRDLGPILWGLVLQVAAAVAKRSSWATPAKLSSCR